MNAAKKALYGLVEWVDARFPLTELWNEHAAKYYAPKNFNFWYYFGSLALVVLLIEIVTGIWLTMSYKPDAGLAFGSVEYIMRDVKWGWLLRYLHSTGASAFFLIIYLHMFRGLLYGSYKRPREFLWLTGAALFFLLMAQAFTGYLLPWGQMSFWAAQVITALFGAIPYIGETLVEWVRGDYMVSDMTLNRFFAFHVVAIPLVLIGFVVIHILALHKVGSGNPDGVEINYTKDAQGIPLDSVPFHPYYTVKDLVGIVVFLILFFIVVFFMPEFGGLFLEYDNFVPANPLSTPEHIKPAWYLTPFYAILRAIPNKMLGVIALGASVFLFFLLPWLDRSPVKSIRYRGVYYRTALGIFVVSFLVLGYLGTQPAVGVMTRLAQVFTGFYFAFFLLMPIYTKLDKNKPVPERMSYP
ncbi:MAG TPA: cytochrome b N-terminal domain-containing protein [Gammaproteobacteria bacterium]|nr:cytochrome b N-terminal domain-containing protein [Gammaproteobacteria bacterium]